MRSPSFYEEFEVDPIYSNRQPNREFWNVVNAPSNVNEELQFYSPNNVRLEDGLLKIKAKREDYGDRRYTSGRIDTKDKVEMLYGTISFRAKLPRGKGFWPALWLVHHSCAQAAPCELWPPEIDLMEANGADPNRIIMNLHFNRYPNNHYVFSDVVGPDFTSDFHIFSVDWFPDSVTYYVDGIERWKLTDAAMIPHERMYLVINLAIGGIYIGGDEPSDTDLENEFIIDYLLTEQYN